MSDSAKTASTRESRKRKGVSADTKPPNVALLEKRKRRSVPRNVLRKDSAEMTKRGSSRRPRTKSWRLPKTKSKLSKQGKRSYLQFQHPLKCTKRRLTRKIRMRISLLKVRLESVAAEAVRSEGILPDVAQRASAENVAEDVENVEASRWSIRLSLRKLMKPRSRDLNQQLRQ